MPDVWATVAELDAATQERLAAVLETRGADLKQQEMRRIFLDGLDVPAAGEVLDVGCGTGVLSRALARLPAVGTVVGVDLASSLLDRARERSGDIPNLEYEQADARSLPFADERFDVVVFDSTLSHVPEPERALDEAFRVLRPRGALAAFDGDYATATVALDERDPLQTCVDAMMANSVTDLRIMRRLPTLLRDRGFLLERIDSHGFVETGDAGYMLTVIDRGADTLRANGTIGDDLAAALKAEARRRDAAGGFFGHIAYVSVLARRPAR